MEGSNKNIKINSSSLVSLKAELLRKEQEYQAERLQPKSTRPRHIKTKVKEDGLGSENSGVAARAAKDLEEKLIEDNEAKNAREILEKKAKVYDAMAKGYLKDDDENEDCLVDFHQKQVYMSRQTEATQKTPEPRQTYGEGGLHTGDTPWSNYSDEKTQNSPAAAVHYANVQHNEIRTHGVGYFQFSEDNAKRQEQVDLLNKLRSQTEDQKAKKERLKEKKQNLMAQRLAKMRQRRGLPEPQPEEEEEVEQKPEVVPLVRDDTWRQIAPITREWDKGKKPDINKSYLETRRDERLQEFAPPVEFQLGSTMPGSQSEHHRPPSTKTATTELNVSEPKVNPIDIEKTLKSIRTETENNVSHPPDPSHSVSDLSSAQRDNVGDIPLPPAPEPTSQQAAHQIVVPHPIVATPSLTDNQISTLSAPPREPSDIPLPSDPVGDNYTPPVLYNQTSYISNDQEVQTGGTCAQMTYMPQEIPHWQHVDTSKPPPSLVYEPQHSQSIPQVLPSVTAMDQTSPIEVDADSVAPTLLGAPAETASTTENSRKRHLAPQPAHYSSAPSKVHIPRPAYERVHLHQLPLTLPAPPTEDNVPQYKAQDAAHIPKVWDKQNKQNKNVMHMWNSQYKYKESK